MQCLEQGRAEDPAAGFGGQLGPHRAGSVCPGGLCAPQPSQGALPEQEVLEGRAAPWEELGVWQCWELCCSSHTFPPPPGLLQAPGPRTAPALAPGRAPGAAFVEGSRIPLEAEAQGPVQCGSSPPHQPHGPAGAPSWGSSQALVFPFPLLGQRPELSNEEGKEALLSLAWERGAPGRAQEAAEHGAHPEVSPLHVAISTSAGPGLCPGWLQPWFPSAALGSAGVGAQPSILGAGRAVPHGAAPAAVAWTSLWF